MIHSTAIIHPRAELDSSVQVGPFAVIDENVVLGPGCVVGPHVHLTGQTIVGAENVFHAGCVIGDVPQDLRHCGQPTALQIGDRNIFREHATVHRSNKADEPTVVGSDNLLMAHSHVGHNAVVGNHAILANGALIGGHAEVHDRAFISGNCLVHQFVRVGTLALMQGGAAIAQDLPPYTVAQGRNGMCGLNIVGLRRAGFTPEQRLELKQLYRLLFRDGFKLEEAVARARESYDSELASVMIDFVAGAKRGLCREVGGLRRREH
jgi:UDP-N-acetylglucosamine acyltransferase